jgi:aryl-alcohol dehydrogenase-like predicted oxidoreductase
VIGSLLDHLVPRDDVVIATKAGLTPYGYRRRDGSRGNLLRSLDASLRRLGTDYVDLWQVHGYDPQTPLEETLSALDHAVTSGRVRYVGVSNFAAWQTARAATWQAAYPGRAPMVAAQMEYSLLERGIERELLPAAAALGLGVLAWSPLGRGVLTGKYRDGRPLDSRAATEHLAAFVRTYLEPRSSSIVQAVATAAAGLGVSPVEVSLAWIRDRPGVTAPILGARTAGQLQGALQSEDLVLPAEIIGALDDVSAIDVGYPEREGVGYPDGEG